LSARETIGVDLGGTKMLVGVVDSDQHVHHESRESSTGMTEDEVVEGPGRQAGRGGRGAGNSGDDRPG
jgi:hypothetical protein